MRSVIAIAVLVAAVRPAHAFEIEAPVSARAAAFPIFDDAPAPNVEQRRAIADRVLAAIAALVLRPGCDVSNDDCNAPELEEPVGSHAFGCAASGATSGIALLVTLWLPMFVRRRRVAAIVAAVVMMSIAPAVRASPWIDHGSPLAGLPFSHEQYCVTVGVEIRL